MKKLLISVLFALLLGGVQQTKAQISVGVQIGSPPDWAPYGYADERYYFIPDLDVYYDVWDQCYWYPDRGVWFSARILPSRYAYFDLYSCYKVPLRYRGLRPYTYYNNHCTSYYRYRNYKGPRQYTYRDRGGYHPQANRSQAYRGSSGGNNRGGYGSRPARIENHGNRGGGNHNNRRGNQRIERPSGNPNKQGMHRPAGNQNRQAVARPSGGERRGGNSGRPSQSRGGDSRGGRTGRP